MNSENFYQAKGVCDKWLNFENNPKKFNDYENLSEKEKIYYNTVLSVRKLGITESKNLMNEFKKTHWRIDKYFLKGKKFGYELMNLDSKIAYDVCDHFLNKKIPILPIHDSFIVEKQYKKELDNVMDEMFQKYANGFKCPRK